MGISLPYDPKKRYLDGIDWTIAALDALNKSQTPCGNVSQLVLTLSCDVDENMIRNRLTKVSADLLFLSGKIERDTNLAPYWHAPRAVADAVIFECIAVGDEPAAQDALVAQANKPFVHARQHLRFTLVRGGRSPYLAMQFDHLILDARGAEMLLSFVVVDATIDPTVFCVSRHPFLDRWKDCFADGRDVNRFLRGLHDVDAVAVLAKQRLSMSRQSAFSVHAFTADESSAIEKIAQDTAGYLMVMPYLMAVTMQSFYAVYAGEGTAIVSLNADTRGRNAKPETLFFNRLSFYHLRAARETTHDLKRLCADLRLQWYDQTKNGIPAKIASASLLTRILPLSLMRMGVESGLAKNPVSFAFSYIGPSTSSGTESMSTAFGADVTDLRHMPIVPYHPGIGVFFTKWNGVLHLVLSYCPAQVIPAVAERFAAVIVDTLKGAI